MFSKEEVIEAISQMGPSKAPGSDGLNPGFYQKFWADDVGEDTMAAVLDFLNGNGSIEVFNKTFICLIPKSKHPKELKIFRPISLCNTIYKIASKVLTNRLKGVVVDLVSESQSAFISDWLISDNGW